MTNPDEVFVKIFRNKEEWERQQNAHDACAGKLAEKNRYLTGLAMEVGLDPYFAVGANGAVDVNKLFPPVASKEFHEVIVPNYLSHKNQRQWVHWPSLQSNPTHDIERYWRKIPVEVLEEVKLLNQSFIFAGSMVLWFNHQKEVSLLIGYAHRDKAYLIAYWGDKKVYEEIQKKLEELRNPPAPAPVVVPTPALQPVVKKPKVQTLAQVGVVVSIITIIVAIVLPEFSYYRNKNKSEAVKSDTTGEVASQEVITPYECDTLLIRVSRDVPGIVLGKREIRCQNHGRHWLVDVKTDDNSVNLLLVSEEVFNKIKFGDRLPDVLERKERREY